MLELGSRNGGLSLWTAINGANVLYVLIKPKKHEKYNVGQLMQYKKINVLKIPYKNELNVIMLKSVLVALGYNDNIDNQRITVSEVYSALRKGGEFWFIDNLIASPFQQLMRKKFIRWGDCWRYS